MAIASRASQDFVKIKEIRDGVLILKDGGMRAILMVSSINFALKSEDNQIAIIEQFQNMLNSLDFSVQIVVQSRRFDVKPYLEILHEKLAGQRNELLQIQTREYIEFIRKFTDNTNIMNKFFFIVVPYSPAILEIKQKGSGLTGAINKALPGKSESSAKSQTSFEEHRSQLEQRVSIIEQGLIRMGIRATLLGTEEIVELFYKLFNPGETEHPVTTG